MFKLSTSKSDIQNTLHTLPECSPDKSVPTGPGYSRATCVCGAVITVIGLTGIDIWTDLRLGPGDGTNGIASFALFLKFLIGSVDLFQFLGWTHSNFLYFMSW